MIQFILYYTFAAIVLSWILKIEKCECSQDWRRDYIKYFMIISVVATTLLGLFALTGRVGGIPRKTIMALGLPYLIAALINTGSILTYIPSLKKSGCDCATDGDWRDNFIFWYMIVSIIVGVLASMMVFKYT